MCVRDYLASSPILTRKLWDVATAKKGTATLEGHAGTVHAVAFSPADRTVASGSAAKTLTPR